MIFTPRSPRFEECKYPTSSPHITYRVKVCLFLKLLENQIVKTLFQGFDLREVGMDNLVKLLKDRVEVLARYFQ